MAAGGHAAPPLALRAAAARAPGALTALDAAARALKIPNDEKVHPLYQAGLLGGEPEKKSEVRKTRTSEARRTHTRLEHLTRPPFSAPPPAPPSQPDPHMVHRQG